MELHIDAFNHGDGVKFGLPGLSSVEEQGCNFIVFQNIAAIARRFDLLRRSPGALRTGPQDGWRLIDEPPSTDVEIGAVMDPRTFASSRWKRHPALVFIRLMKKHECEVVDLEGHWCQGDGEIHDAFF